MQHRTIYALWNTGRASAPSVVRRVFESWSVHAPDYHVEILDGEDLRGHLRDLGLEKRDLTIQAASDILRTKLLHERGGVWLDATCLLSAPFGDWAPALAQRSGFFAFTRPGKDRLISSWCILAEENNVLLGKLLESLRAYWSVDRRIYMGFEGVPRWNSPSRRARKKALANPRWAVDPKGGALTPFAPYYFFHYLFELLVETDPEAAAIWEQTPKISAVPAHCIGLARENGDFERLDERSVDALLAASPIHKLNWRHDFPEALFQKALAPRR